MENKKIPYDKLCNLKGPNSVEATPLLSTTWSEKPKDLFLFTYFIFFLHGIGHLLPWNFFITARLYFHDRFTCPGESSNGTDCRGFDRDFESFFSVAAMVPLAVMTGVNIWLQTKMQYKYRMVLSLIVMVALFVLTIAFVGVPTSQWVDGFFAVTVISVVILNFSSAIFQSSTFGFAGLFPPKYTAIVLSGQAVAGVFAAVIQIISLAASSGDLKIGAFGYFSTGLVLVLICLVTFLIMTRLKFVQFYLKQTSVKNIETKQREVARASVNVKTVDTSVPFMRIFSEIWLYAISAFLVFAVTLSLFPGVLANIESTSPYRDTSGWTSTYFSPLVCFLLFNCSDFVGRFITHWICVGSNQFVLFSCCVSRVLLVPLILLCNIEVGGHRSWPVVFDVDIYPILFTTLMGISNGYFASVAMISAPQRLSPDHRETGSTIMAFFLSAGLLVGSCFSFLWTYLIAP